MRSFTVMAIALALASQAAPAAVIGTGTSVVIAGGNGVDLVLWRDGPSGRSMAVRFGPTGAALDAVPIQLPPGAGSPEAAAWDGTGFVIATAGSNAPILRLPVSGGNGFSIAFDRMPGTAWAAVASDGAGTSLFVWEASSIVAASVSSAGDLLSHHQALPLPISGDGAHLVRDGPGYLLAHVPTCAFPACPPQTESIVQRLDDRGNLVGAAGSVTFPYAGMTVSSLAGGPRPLLAVSGGSTPLATSLLSFDPGAQRAARRTIRFPAPLTAQTTAAGQALIGLGARIDVSETGAPLAVTWAPVAETERLAGVLPSSGMRVIVPASGAGPIAVEAAPNEISEVGLAPVHISAESVWLKIDNRGPGSPKLIDLWVTGRVSAFTSLNAGTIAHFGALTRIRFQTNLKPIAGFEVAMSFLEPIDPNAFEAWVLTLGTDRDATNDYVTRRAEPVPEPPTPTRRRTVRR